MIMSSLAVLAFAVASDAEPTISRYGIDVTERVVRVDNAALVHTTQLLAADGHLNSIDHELKDVFRQLASSLHQSGSTTTDLIRLNVYVDQQATHAAAIKYILNWCPKNAAPAVTSVTTPLPGNRRLAIDAVFAARGTAPDHNVEHQFARPSSKKTGEHWARASVLPPGDVVYISGQAQAGDLPTATRSTLKGLLETLRFMKLTRADIVQVKCFVQPMKDIQLVEREISLFFDGAPIPAVSHVEWIVGGSRPIEIEIVAAAPETKTTETVSYYTPPEMKSSPVFSRVARIHGNRRIYTSGISATGDGQDQVNSVFQQLIRLLKPTRSNLRHLAKATYYVADSEVSADLNRLRPHFYDPQRPPAASKAMIHGVPADGRSMAIDIIAAPESPLTSVLTTPAEAVTPARKVIYKTVNDRPLHLHLFEPDGHRPSDRRPVFLAIHGGGWTGGNARVFFPFAGHFARQGMLGISLEYRLKRDSDGTTVFDCVRDARSAVRWIRTHAEELGADPERIVVMGGSAGAHLAISTALFEKINEPHEDTTISSRPDALILMYPVIDTSAEGYGQQKIGKRWRELSPVHNVRAGLPPTLLFHGTADAVTPYPAARRFHEQSIGLGNTCDLVTHPGGRHGYIIFNPQEFENALSRMQEFMAQHGLHLH